MKQTIKYLLPVFIAATCCVLTLCSLPAQAADSDFSDGITVDSIADTPDNNIGDGICNDGSGNCTLRAAIANANSHAGADSIEFNISGTGVHTIQPLSALPQITGQVTIDGYSQPGAQANTATAPNPLNGILLIELDGSGAGVTAGLTVGSDNSIIKGLVINRFQREGIAVGADDIKIEGNYIGTDPTGLIARPNILMGIAQAADGSERLTVGGLTAAKRNLISGNADGGISPNTGSNDWVIQGNYIGVDSTGLSALPNSQIGGAGALSVDNSTGHIIGGSQAGAINVISGNLGSGIAPDNASNVTVEGNYIGVGYDGTTPLGNGQGISTTGTSSNFVIKNNIIANSGDSGVSVSGASEVSVIGNSIYDNDSKSINLNAISSINDLLDADSGPNDLLNFPDNLEYAENTGNTNLRYTLDVPAGSYRVEFFSNTTPDPIYNGEGETYLGFQNVTSTGSGSQIHTHTLTGASIPNITATATVIDSSSDGFGPTSEFSAVADQRADISVNTTLLNPQDVAVGATINYELEYINNGLNVADLTGVATPGGPAVFLDFVNPEFVPANQTGPGPIPDVDSSNPDLTCVWLSNASAVASISVDLTAHPDYSLIACWYTGGETTLANGDSISATLSFVITNDSDLNFTNYIFTAASTDSNDPDAAALVSIFTSGNDVLDGLIAANGSINNFTSVPFPLPVETHFAGSSGSSSLAETGQNNPAILAAAATLTILGGAFTTLRLSKRSSHL